MINTHELLALRGAFQLLSEAIDYPTERLLSVEFRESLGAAFPAEPEHTELLAIIDELQQHTLGELRETYTQLFEHNKRLTLYCTYYRFEDSRERGTVLSKLKMLYEMFGVSLGQAELTDYLPTMLEFLAYGDFEGDARLSDMSLLFSVLEDGTYKLLSNADEYRSEPYIRLVAFIRRVLKTCVTEERIAV